MKNASLKKAARIILILIGIVWVSSQIYFTIIPFDKALSIFTTATNTKASDFLSEPTFYNETLDNLYQSLFGPFLLNAAIVSFLGLLILTKGRSLFEAIWLLGGLAIPKPRKYWGTIKDQNTNSPVSLAIVRLIKEIDDKEVTVSDTVSDLDGKYRIRFEDSHGDFILEVKADAYESFRKKIEYQYKNLLKNEINEDILLVRLDTSVNSLKRFYYSAKPHLFTFLIYYIYFSTILLFIHSLYGILVYQQIDTVIAITIYSIAFIWNTYIIKQRLNKDIGKILDSNTKKPLNGTLAVLSDGEKNLESVISGEDGTLKFNVKSGNYLLQLSKDGYSVDQRYKTNNTGFISVTINEEGNIDNNIYLTPIKPNIKNNTLLNPFS